MEEKGVTRRKLKEVHDMNMSCTDFEMLRRDLHGTSWMGFMFSDLH